MKRLLMKLLLPNTYSSEAYIKYMTKRNIDIGKGCIIYSPNQTYIDLSRPHMLHIGDYVKITRNVTILCHDYSRSVVLMYAHENYGEAKMTWIGNNVFIGNNATILMGTHIADNSIIAAGAVVSGTFPDGVVIAGNPAKIICTIDEYAKKRKQKTLQEAVDFVKCYKSYFGKFPTVKNIGNPFSWIYLPHTKETIEKYPQFFQFNGIDKEQMISDFLNTKPLFDSYEDFLDYVGKQE